MSAAELILATGSMPPAPASGRVTLYAGSDDQLYWRDAAGSTNKVARDDGALLIAPGTTLTVNNALTLAGTDGARLTLTKNLIVTGQHGLLIFGGTGSDALTVPAGGGTAVVASGTPIQNEVAIWESTASVKSVSWLTLNGTHKTFNVQKNTAPSAALLSTNQAFMGSADAGVAMVLSTGSNTANQRPLMQAYRARGTHAAPAAVVTDDYGLSLVASFFDGTAYQTPCTIDIFCDGTPIDNAAVPGRIAFSTGSNVATRVQRLIVKNDGAVWIGKISGGATGAGNVDIAGSLYVDNQIYIAAQKVVSTRRTGWTAATGTATRTAFNTSNVTLVQLAERVKALLLLAHGLLGA